MPRLNADDVVGVQVVADLGAAEPLPHAAAGQVADHHAELAEVAVAEHQVAVALARERHRHRQVVGRAGRALEHDPLVGELVDVERLGHAAGHVDLLVEQRPHPGRRVDREVVAQLARARAQAVAAQEQRRVDRAAGHDHRVGLDAQAAAAGGASVDGAGAAIAHLDVRRPRARVRRRPGLPGERHVAHVRRLLGRRRAAEHAHARAHAAADVAVDEVARPAEGVGAALDDERVAAGQLGRHLGDVDDALDAAEVRVELVGRELLEAEAAAPHLEDRRRGAEAGAGVDRRGPADPAAERQDDRRVAHRDRHAPRRGTGARSSPAGAS